MSETEPNKTPSPDGLPYVFIIGFNKCGTRTLSHFFSENGFPTIHWDNGNLARTMMANAAAGLPTLQTYDHSFRVFADLTFFNTRVSIEANTLFPTLDRDYPRSFFIYNTRPIDNWIASRMAHRNSLGETLAERYALAVGIAPSEVPAAWRAERYAFEDRIARYFAESTRLLILDIEESNAAARIAKFLGLDMNFDAWTWLGRTHTATRAEADSR
jgi:hypothetical protein